MTLPIYGISKPVVTKQNPDNMCEYVRTLNNILTQLNTQKKKEVAINRINVLRELIRLRNPEL